MIYGNMLHAISTSMCLSISNSKATIMIQVKTPPDSYNLTLKLISTCFTCAYELKTASYIPAAQTARGKSSRPNTWSSL